MQSDRYDSRKDSRPTYVKLEDLSESDRDKIFKDHKHMCVGCETRVKYGDGCDITQFKGRKSRGTSDIDNQILLCKDCWGTRGEERAVKLPEWLHKMIDREFDSAKEEHGWNKKDIVVDIIVKGIKKYFEGDKVLVKPNRLIILDERDQKKAIAHGLKNKSEEFEKLSETSAEVSKLISSFNKQISSLNKQFSKLADDLSNDLFQSAARQIIKDQFLNELKYQIGEVNEGWMIAGLDVHSEIDADDPEYKKVKRSKVLEFSLKKE